MNARLRPHRPLRTRIRHTIVLVAVMSCMANRLPVTGHTPQSLFAISTAHAAEGIHKPIHYQGKVQDGNGDPVANGAYNMRFRLFDVATGGSALWTETWDGTTTQITMTGGLFSIALGTHVSMDDVNFNSDSLFLQVEFDATGDASYAEVFAPRRRLGSVPYAHNAARLNGLQGSQFLRTDQANTTTGSLFVNTGGLAIRTQGTISGSVLHADRLLSSSGGLLILQKGTNPGARIVQEGNGIALDLSSLATTQPGLRISMPTDNAANNPHILFGYANTFDAKLYRSGTAQLTLKAETNVENTDVFRILSNVTTSNNLIFRVESDGDVRADGTVQGGGADYAEWFFSHDALLPGEVVCIDVERRNTVARCTRDADVNLMGIVSTRPAFVGNAFWGLNGIQPPGYHLIGLIGQVPARVTDAGGAIRAGDSLTAAAMPGFARRAQAGESTVGVALEAFDGGSGVINVLISRRNQSLTVEAVEEKIVERISAMEIEDEVRLMVSEALGDLTVEESITEAVQTQIDALAVEDAITAEVTRQTDALRQELIALRNVISGSGTLVPTNGSGSAVVQTQNFASLRGTSMELEETLIVGTDARIGGDLYLDGSLIMKSLYVPGSIDIENTVHAGRIEAGSGSRIEGALILDGELRMGTGSIRYQTGAITISDLLVERSVFILGDVTIEGLARFAGVVEIAGELRLPTKQAGRTRILAGEKSVDVRFGTSFSTVPIVTISPEDFALSSWRVHPVTATGFTIELQRTALTDIGFAWHAFVTVEDGPMARHIDPNAPIPFPIDTAGVPVSSDAVWNACIRGVRMTDPDGIAFDCSPFHDAATWRHPDLHIAFVWNDDPNLAGPFLQIPPGYVTEVTDTAANVARGFTRTEPVEATDHSAASSWPSGDPEGTDATEDGTGATMPLPDNGSGATMPAPENETGALAPPTDTSETPPPKPAPTETTSSMPSQPSDPAATDDPPPMTPVQPPPAVQEPAADASPPMQETPPLTPAPASEPTTPPSDAPPVSTTLP